MSDLYGVFEAATSGREQLDPSRRDLLVEVIGRTATRRRRRRYTLNAAASLAGVALVGGGVAAAGWWGPTDGTVGPADATNILSVSPPSSPSPSPSASDPENEGFAGPFWTRVEPGWFLVEYQTLEQDSVLMLIAPDGEARLVEPPAEYAGGTVAAWLGGETMASQDAVSMYLAGKADAAIVAVIDEVTTALATPSAGGAESIYVVHHDDADEPAEACVTGDDYGDALVTPDGSGVLCFEPVSENETRLVRAPTVGTSAPAVLATFAFPASDYARLGWVSDTTLLFGRELDKGYRYFTFDIDTWELADVFLPGDLDGWVPSYDLTSATYRLVTPGKVEFFTEDGDSLATVECATNVGLPRAWVSATTALVACPGIGDSQWDLSIVDVTNGTTTEVISIADSDGEDALTGVFPYPAFAD